MLVVSGVVLEGQVVENWLPRGRPVVQRMPALFEAIRRDAAVFGSAVLRTVSWFSVARSLLGVHLAFVSRGL
jgi:hypothetical protein